MDDAAVLDADVVRRQTAGALLAALFVQREVGADLLPALAAVARLMEILAADVNLVVIVRRNMERRVPDEPVFQISGRAIRVVGPDFHVAHLAATLVVAHDDPTDASRPRCSGPDDVRIGRIGRREAALPSADRMPHAARDAAAAAAAAAPTALAQAAVAGPPV